LNGNLSVRMTNVDPRDENGKSRQHTLHRFEWKSQCSEHQR